MIDPVPWARFSVIDMDGFEVLSVRYYAAHTAREGQDAWSPRATQAHPFVDEASARQFAESCPVRTACAAERAHLPPGVRGSARSSATRSEYGPTVTPGDEDRRAEPRACEDCGSDVVSEREPFAHADSSSGQEPAAYRYERSDWCTNLDCPSNQLRGLRRTGVDDYRCLECDAVVRTPFPDVTAHRRGHTGQSDEPGSYSYT